MDYGLMWGLIGIMLCVLLCGVGSAIGLMRTGQSAAGVLGEDPKRYSKVLVLVVLPATQGIYGFVFAIVAASLLNFTGGMEIMDGLRILFASLPLTVTGLLTHIFQSRSAAACINAVAKKESLSGRLILFPAMIETYAILSLVISLLLLA